MSVKTQIMSSEWSNDLTNGSDFTLNSTEKYKVITGNVDERVKVKAVIRIITSLKLTNWHIKASGALTLGSIFGQGLFSQDISVGDKIRLVMSSNQNQDRTGTVTSVTDDIIYFVQNQNWNLPNNTYADDYLYIISDLKDIRYTWGLFPDEDTTEYTSKLDGSSQTYIGKGMTVSNNIVTATGLGKNWINGSFKSKFVGYAKSPYNNSGNWLVAQDFEIEHDFIIQNYTENQKTDILGNLKPLDYLGNLTYSYGAEVALFKDVNEPDTIKKADVFSDGNIGWYNENYNGTISNKEISNISFARVTNSENISGLCVEKTKVSFKISNCTVASKVVVRHKALKDKRDYYLSTQDYKTLFSESNVRVIDSLGVSKDSFENAKITLVGTDLFVEFDFDVSNNSFTGSDYIISVSVEENKLNRVNLIADIGQYIGGFDVDGLVEDVKCDITPRGYSQSFSNVNLMLDELCDLQFDFSLVNSLGAELQQLAVWTILTNGTDFIKLDSDQIDITDISLINGVQRINKTLNFGYNISGAFFAWISSTATKSRYILKLPYRVPSQNNIQNLNVPDVFYDTNKPNNGLNINAYDKQANGYEIKIGLYLLVSGTEYLFHTEKIDILNYEQNI